MDPTEWAGVMRDGRDLYTPNGVPGVSVYGEDLRTVGGVEYRRWDPFRSKLCAFLLRGAPATLLRGTRSVLYLGGAHGTTASHLADLLPAAPIFVVEKSPTSFGALLTLSRRRTNLFPMLADAQLPERYSADVGRVDFLYQDVAQRNQVDIFRENVATCLRPEGTALLMLKIASVTQRRPPAAVVRQAKEELRAAGLRLHREAVLAPFSREHVALLVGR